jgi:hypothetical protein
MSEWYTIEQLRTKKLVKESILNELESVCDVPGCGCPIIVNEELTKMRCANPDCYGHMKHRADDMCKQLDIKGIGPETCYKILRDNHLKNHFQVLPYVLKDGKKPRLHLWEIAKMAAIPGVSKRWEDLLEGIPSFEKFFEDRENYKKFYHYKQLLIEACQYFDIKPTLSGRVVSIAIHGSIKGYRNRKSFVDDCNDIFGSVIKVRLRENNQSNDYLVTEETNTIAIIKKRLERMQYIKTSSLNKMELAIYCGIPIKTPNEFIQIILKYIQENYGNNVAQ